MNSITSRADAGDNLQSSLSIKISFIVYWGMILVGLLATFVLLHGREKEITDFYTTNANSLAYEMGEFIDTREKFSSKREGSDSVHPPISRFSATVSSVNTVPPWGT